MIRNTKATYGSVAKTLHWLIFILVTFMLVLGYCMDDVTDKAIRGVVVNIHKVTGLTILLLMILRLSWALTNPKPELPAGSKPWELYLERAGHYFLYLILFAMPVAGWVMSVAAGHAPHVFDIKLSLPISQNHKVSDFAMGTHDTLAIVIIVVVSLHVLAALYHLVVKKDNVMQRMMPGEN